MSKKEYVSLSRLQLFLDNLVDKFAPLNHKHTLSDVSDFAVDDALSSTSTNPVQNKVVDAEFEAISEAFSAYEAAIDDKVAKSEVDLLELITTEDIDRICGYTA